MRERVPCGRQTSAAETAWAPCGGRPRRAPAGALAATTGTRSLRGPASTSCGAAPPRPLAAAPPEVETRASHDAPRGPYSNCAEKREEVVMAAPGPEVLCPAAVPGKAWGPQLREPWGPVSFLPLLTSLLAHGLFSGPSSLPSLAGVPPGSRSIAPSVLDPIGSCPLCLPLRGVLRPAGLQRL